MAKDLNKFMATGRLGKDPEMRFTPQGSAVTTFSIASGRMFVSNGEKREETEWINCTAWDKLAELCNRALRKASRVYVEGRLKTTSWEKEGVKHYRTDVILTDVIFLDNKSDEGDAEDGSEPRQSGSERPNGNGSTAQRQSAPAARTSQRNAPQTIDNDEDLPF